MLQTLIKNGADLNARNKDGLTPLHGAAANNTNPEMLQTLIKKGASIKATIKGIVTIWDLMERNYNLEKNEAYWELQDLKYQN